MRAVQVLGCLFVPVARAEHIFRCNELYAAELAQEFGCLFLYGDQFQLGIFYRFAVQINLVVIETLYPVCVLAVESHQVHIEQGDAPFRVKFAVNQLHPFRVFFFALVIAGTGEYDQRIVEPDLLVDLVQQFLQVLIQLIVSVLYFAGVFLVHVSAIVAGIISDGKHIRTRTCTESSVFEELKRQAVDFLIDKG